METQNKIKQEQLETILEQRNKLTELLHNIGVLESQKHSLLHQIADVNKTIEDFKVVLFEEYGDININIEDGSYTKIEKVKEPETVKELEIVK
jgi:hypothetical protein